MNFTAFLVTFLMLFPTVSKIFIFADYKSSVTGHPGDDTNFNTP